MSKFAWVTCATNDTYSLGALVLANSLKRVSTVHQLAIIITPGVSETMKNRLKDVYNVVQEVDVMDSQDTENLALLARPELGITFTKLQCWKIVQFEKCVFLDADTLVLQNSDELFDRDEFSAAPDVSWPDCFNSGVFVYRPSLDTYGKIKEFALKHGSFDGGDQGVLNQYFSDWAHTDINKHLPFIYNTTAFASYCYLPAFKQFRDRIKILHFAGKLKPWLVTFNTHTKISYTPQGYEHAADLIQLWWNIFCDSVHQNLSTTMKLSNDLLNEVGLAGALASVKLGEPRTLEQEQYEELMRRQCWEAGQIDYTGKDSFDNIWKKISQTIDTKPTKAEQTDKSSKRLTSADIEDGRITIDPRTKAKTEYKLIPGGYSVTTTTPEPNGCYKSETKTFYDPVPVTDETDENSITNTNTRKLTQVDKTTKVKLANDPNTTVETRRIPNGREEIYTTIRPDGTKSIQVKTFYDEQIIEETTPTQHNTQITNVRKNDQIEKKNQQSQQIKKLTNQESTVQEYKMKSEKTVEETRRVTQTSEKTGKSISTRTDSVEENEIKSLTTKKDIKKKKPKGMSGPPVPPEFVDKPGEKTTVVSKKIPNGTEFLYTTVRKDGTTVTSTKTIYEEEEIEMTEEEIREYQKQLKEAEKHKDIKKTISVNTKEGQKKVIPSENPGDVTTVETIKIPGGTEYHYTTITAEGLVKKSSKTVFDPTPVQKENEDDTDEEEIIEEYEEEVIEPGDKITRTIETVCNLSSRQETREVIEKKKLGQSAIVSEGMIKKKGVKKSKQ